ncbi:Hypothetical protein MVR_LOCUS45 [uncultured virus]|nr:Hypothetical protein MVR_LOCUS45 [uncultured virus]
MTDQAQEYENTTDIGQLDKLILDLHNVAYDRSGNYETDFITIPDLTEGNMKRFKLTDYDLDTIFDKTPIKYVGTYPTGLVYYGKPVEQICIKRQGEVRMTTIRIVPYTNASALRDPMDPVNVNQIIRTVLSELVVNGRTSNILLPIINVDVQGSDLAAYPIVKPLVTPSTYYSIQITEKFYSLTTLADFLKEYSLDARILKTIIYQAVDVLYQISLSYPNFRHNQFLPEYISCYLRPEKSNMYPELKLTDFYLSDIGDLVPNAYLTSGEILIPSIESNYSDFYQFLNNLWNTIEGDILKFPEIVEIFDTLLPKKIRSDYTYLSTELYDKLTDDEKSDLNLKNIRNNTFFTSRDSPPGSDFAEIPDVIDGAALVTEGEDDLITSDEESQDDIPTLTLTQQSRASYQTTNRAKKDARLTNKKYSDIDIDSMRNNNQARSKQANHNSRLDSESDLPDDFDDFELDDTPAKPTQKSRSSTNSKATNNRSSTNSSEYRGERRIGNEASRVEQNSDKSKGKGKGKSKVRNYRGVRHIQNFCTQAPCPTDQQGYGNQMASYFQDPTQSRVSNLDNGQGSQANMGVRDSIAGALGAEPGRGQQPQFYDAQQMAQMFNQQQPSQMPAQTAPQQSYMAQAFNPNSNQGQNQGQISDAEMKSRFRAVLDPTQQPFDQQPFNNPQSFDPQSFNQAPQFNQQQMQAQAQMQAQPFNPQQQMGFNPFADSNSYQQPMAMNQQAMAMNQAQGMNPLMGSMNPHMLQTGGAKPNPFFFQPGFDQARAGYNQARG